MMAIQVDDSYSSRLPRPPVISSTATGRLEGSIYYPNYSSYNRLDEDPSESQPLLVTPLLNRLVLRLLLCPTGTKMSLCSISKLPNKSGEVQQLQFEEDEQRRKKRWMSIYIMYFTMFLTALSKRWN